MQDEFKEIKKQLKKIRNQYKTAGCESETEPTSNLEKTCRELTMHSTSLHVYVTVNLLLRKLFSVDEILSHSVSGKAANSKTAAKPKFDSERLELLQQIAVDRDGVEAGSQSTVTLKIQAVQKAVKQEKEARAKNPEKKD